MPPIILHHYSGSPYAEKIRLVLGAKRLPWRSLPIAVTPPRPSLLPILGEFRRTPVLQIGADFFCDTRLIARVLDGLSPQHDLQPSGSRELTALLAGWVEPRVFAMMGPVRFMSAQDVLGIFDGQVDVATFFTDRAPFISPAIDATRFAQLRDSALDHVLHWLRLLAGLLGGKAYLCDRLSLADFTAYHTVWWLRAKPARQALLASLPNVAAWADRIAAIGHGEHSPITTDEALAQVAEPSEWQTPWPTVSDARLGRATAICPDDYGKNALRGVLHQVTDEHVVLRRLTSHGEVRVHFPRHGYEITTETQV